MASECCPGSTIALLCFLPLQPSDSSLSNVSVPTPEVSITSDALPQLDQHQILHQWACDKVRQWKPEMDHMLREPTPLLGSEIPYGAWLGTQSLKAVLLAILCGAWECIHSGKFLAMGYSKCIPDTQ